MNLYQLTTEFASQSHDLANLDLDDQTLADTLEGLAYPLEVKASNVAAFCLNLEADALAVKAVEERVIARRKLLEKRADALRAYLKRCMEIAGITEISAIDKSFSIKIKQNPESVKVEDEGKIPPDYFVEKVTVSLDKNLVKSAIKDGFEVPGCHLERGTRLEIK
jgi:hypothetical protein